MTSVAPRKMHAGSTCNAPGPNNLPNNSMHAHCSTTDETELCNSACRLRRPVGLAWMQMMVPHTSPQAHIQFNPTCHLASNL
jgi:hypothetical protein